MKKSLPLLTFTLSFHVSHSLLAQLTPIPKLEVKIGTTYPVGPGNILLVDTLVMQDRSTIQFASVTQGKLVAKVAFIGYYCTVMAKGENGIKGQDGSIGGKKIWKKSGLT